MSKAEDLFKKIDKCENDVNDLLRRTDAVAFLTDASMLRERLEIHSSDLRWLREQGPWNAAIEEAQGRVKTLLHRLESLTAINVLCRDNAKILFQEAGQWARHFSTVRMTVATFTITSCTAIIALAAKKDGLVTASNVAAPVAVLWALGLCVFWIFTIQTYRKLYQQRKGLPIFLMRSLSMNARDLPFDLASLVIAFLCFAASAQAYFLPNNEVGFIFVKSVLGLTTIYGFYFLRDYRARATKS